MSQALYRKWRPQKWDQVVGQEHIIQTLRNAVSADRVAHAYLFAGPRGTGKTTTARLLAKAVNCLDPDLGVRPCDQCEHCLAVNAGRFLDLIEIDAASNTSVEDVRNLRDKINFSPNLGRYKVYIIDEIHMLSTAAFNALLKTLEEPPSHAIFILATTEVHKIPATVLSRCQRHEFRRIPVADIVAHLKELAQGEKLEISPEAYQLVARQATGSLRDAISLLDQLSSAGKSITLERAQVVLGTAASQVVLELVDALFQKKPEAGLTCIHRALDAGSDPRQFARQVVEYLRHLLLIRMGNAEQVDATPEIRSQMARHAQSFTTPDLLGTIRSFNTAASEARLSWQPSLPLEVAFVEALEQPAKEQAGPALETKAESPAVVRKPAAQPKAQVKAAPEPDFKPDEPPAGSPSHSTLTMEMLSKSWPQVLALVRKRNPQTQGLLNSCSPIGIKDGVLYLGFNSEITRSKMDKTDHLEITQQVLAHVFGVEVPVRCMVSAGKRGAPPPDVDSDGMVATALRDLGGEIVDIQ